MSIKIEGIATISDKGFRFDSRLPKNEPVLDQAQRLHGTLDISQNACVSFEHDGRVYLPPEIHLIAEDSDYRVKRTSRHYLIAIKVPVVDNRQTTQDRLAELLPIIMGNITLDRKEIADIMA